jgi:hypothetical protein
MPPKGPGHGPLLQAEVLEEPAGTSGLSAESFLNLIGFQPETICLENLHG